ncbi:MAG: DUF599 domain-containing protein [Rhodobacteraceae bacterium]|nr:DUF599 domain-containing protein [Paracoccaceae bacterium]
MHVLSYNDYLAVLWFLVAWFGFSFIADVSPLHKRTLAGHMENYRRAWMLSMSARRNRIFDSNIMGGLQQGTAFFASTALLAIGGTLALLDSTETILRVAGDLDLPVEQSRTLWEIKVLGLTLILAYAFFKFSWAYRLFNYTSIIMGSVPETEYADPEQSRTFALKAAELNIIAGRHFNRGQRAFFFAIGFLGWFAGPIVLGIATLAVLIVLARRQFMSNSKSLVMEANPLAFLDAATQKPRPSNPTPEDD